MGALVVAVVGGWWFFNQREAEVTAPEPSMLRTETAVVNPPAEPTSQTIPETPPTDTPVPPVIDTEVAAAISGTFTENTTYLTPKRTSHSLAVSLTVQNDVVTTADVRYDGKDSGFSNTYQERFDAAYKTEVVGKKLSDISLSRVGGASLTSASFNEAIKQVLATTPQS
jgi:hypothetical protein